ncbi:MAG: hydroxypyruvate reductase [Rhodobacteraceae bacterium HLUCCO07]|nr:MAG: hydroxypyruvate reductase [Rhodobacteraceae bacterium HLUCCO07]
MKRLLITRRHPDRTIEAAKALFDVTVRDENDPLSPDELRTALTDYDAVLTTLGDAFSEEIFAAVSPPRATILANFGVGYNHIDVESARLRGVTVTNTPGAVTDATADIAMTLVLMSARRAGEGERMLRAGRWTGWNPMQLLGMHVTGKTVGIVGMGRIGQAIARRCHYGFGMKVIYTNRSEKRMEFPAEQMAQHELARHADIVVVAVPGGRETHHLIGAGFLASMQPHAHFINISRGDVVDENALITALEESRIGGAGLDVYEHEPHVPERLRQLDNAVLLPHLGTAALDVREAMGMMAVENLRAHLEGREPPNKL